MQITLRDYQIKFIADISAAHKGDALRGFSEAHQGIIGQMPTGAGKTICMARIAKALADRNGKVLIVVHRDELVRQTCGKLKMFGLKYGTIAAGLGKNKHPDAQIQVAMVQTVSRKIEKGLLTEFHYLIFDEAHLAAAKSYIKIIHRWPKARRLGLSATPWRLDGQGLSVVGSVVVRGPTIGHLIETGSLVPFTTYSIPVVDLSAIKKVRGEYDIESQGTLYKKAQVVGDVVGHYLRLCRLPDDDDLDDDLELDEDNDLFVKQERKKRYRSGIYFSANIEHSLKLRDKFLEAGISAEHIDGYTPTEERLAVLKRQELGITLIVCNYGCLTEGFDQPIVSVIGIARKTASSALFKQMCGRGLRPHKESGKFNCIILDHGGNALDHGNLDYDFEFSLDGKQKLAAAARLCKTCDNCSAICELSAEICHVCGESFLVKGKVRVIKEAQGELVPIVSGAAPLNEKKKKKEKILSVKQRKETVEGWLEKNNWG